MKRILYSAVLGLTLTCAAFGGGTITWPSAPLPPDANPAAVPVGPCVGWLNHFQQILDASRKLDKIDLIFDGDTYAITGNPKGDHGGFWGPSFAKLNAFEFTNPGDATQNVLWRLQHGQVDNLHPKLIVLLVGAGNLQANTPEQIAAGVKAVIQEYQQRCPGAAILLQGIFPRRELPTDPLRLKIKATNQLIAALGDGKQVIFLDFGDKFLQPDGMMTKEILCDFAFPRPSPKAFKIWADSIQPVIDQFFPPASAPVAGTPAATPEPAQPRPAAPVAVGGTITWPQPPVPPGGNSAVIPVPPMGRLNSFQQAMDDARKMPRVDLVFDGDSITAGWKGGGGGVWGHTYGKRNAVDFGVSGDSTQGLLWRVENGQVDGLHPKLIVLLIGTNNMGLPAEQIAGGIKADVAAYRQHCPDATLLLLGILPRGEKASEPNRAKIKAVNQLIAPLGDGKQVIFLDFGDKLLQPDGTLSKDIMPDLLHPSAKGYQIWADAIQPIVDQFVPLASAPAAPVPASTSPKL